MSTGPNPTFGGGLAETDASPATRSADARRDVNGDCASGSGGGGGWPGGGGDGGGSGGGSCQAPGANGDNGAPTYFDFGASSGDPTGDSWRGFGNWLPLQYYDTGSTLCPPPSNTIVYCVCGGTRIALYPEGCAEAWEIQVDDVVLSRTQDGIPVGERVSRVIETTQPCVEIEAEDGKRLQCSESHPLMVLDDSTLLGKQVVAGALSVSHSLLLEDGASVGIRAVSRCGDKTVFQIMLAGPNHLFLTNGVWSHNKPYPIWGGP